MGQGARIYRQGSRGYDKWVGESRVTKQGVQKGLFFFNLEYVYRQRIDITDREMI